ncbi:MAG: hypothetical protein ABSC61_00290 [Anaerolineales bacterium]
MTSASKAVTHEFEYLKLFGVKARNSKNELLIAEVKGLKSTHISTFRRITGLTVDHIAILLDISRRQINYKMRKGIFSAKDADILLNVAKIIYEFFCLYPDIQDFWLLFLAGRDEFSGKSALYLSKTEIGRGRVLAQIIKERDDYLQDISKDSKTPKNVKVKKE